MEDDDRSLEDPLDNPTFKMMVEAVEESVNTSVGEMDPRSKAEMDSAVNKLVIALRRIEEFLAELQEKKREQKRLAEVLTSEKIPMYMMFHGQSTSKHL